MQVNSRVLWVGHTFENDLEALGATHKPSLLDNETTPAHPVTIVALTSSKDLPQATSFLKRISEQDPSCQKLVLLSNFSASLKEIQELINTRNIFRILNEPNSEEIISNIQSAYERFSSFHQATQLLGLAQSQHQKLTSIQKQLEQRVRKRESYLRRSLQKLDRANHKAHALRNALIAIHSASSVSEMERGVCNVLAQFLNLDWVKILFDQMSLFEGKLEEIKKNFSVFTSSLDISNPAVGRIYFGRSHDKPFSPDEFEFLQQISEAVGLAIDRLQKLEETEYFKQQWESTFDAISHPLALIRPDYTVVRMNRSFVDQTRAQPHEIVGQKCYQVFFHRDAPCSGCLLGEKFRLSQAFLPSGQKATLEVQGYSIELQKNEKVYLHLYRDITQQLQMERQILETAKMGELGTIGSSIAHELNNPLGGLLSFLQLIKSDLAEEDERYQDIVSMEQGALKCKEIILNLLSFTRLSQNNDLREFDLRDTLKQALKITELQAKSHGIHYEVSLPQREVLASGMPNQITQALRNIIQNANEAILEKMKGNPSFHGKVQILSKLSDNKSSFELTIRDNGCGFNPADRVRVFSPFFTNKNKHRNSGLGLTVAQQIFAEHNIQLQISTQLYQGTTVEMVFPLKK